MLTIGIYTLTSKSSGKVYVGQTVNFQRRKYQHFQKLRGGQHKNLHLQNTFDKYGEDDLCFSKLLICSSKDLTFYEQRAIDVLKPEFNIAPAAGSPLGVKHTAKSRANMAAAQNRPETLTKMSKSKRGMKFSPEHRAKLAKAKSISVQCIETGHVFESIKLAGEWCRVQNLTNAKKPAISINSVILGKQTTAFGLHWEKV